MYPLSVVVLAYASAVAVFLLTDPMLDKGCRKIGGIWFARLGRLRLSFCVARA